MKRLKSDLKKGELTLKPECREDLWHLSGIIDQGDLISGRTVRKIKIGDSDSRTKSAVKKSVFIELQVEKVQFSRSVNELRISGVVTSGTEEIPNGAHHTFSITENDSIRIKKPRWLKYQLEKVDESCKGEKKKILIAAFDREEAFFALLTREGYEFLTSIKGNVAKKDMDTGSDNNFYSDIISQLKDYKERYGVEKIIVASPGFWKDYFMKTLKDDALKSMIVQGTCSTVSRTCFSEILKRDEVKSALKEDRIARELNEVELLLSNISKGKLSCYGFNHVKQAAESGAVEKLLLSESFINKSRESGKYNPVEKVMSNVESSQGEVLMISSDHDGGRKLDGIGGIGAILRYDIS